MPRQRKLTRSGVSLEEAAKLIPDLDLANYGADEDWHDDESSDAQDSALERFGFKTDLGVSRGEAAFLLDILVGRAEEGLCSLKQARELRSLGHEDPSAVTYREATAKLRRNR